MDLRPIERIETVVTRTVTVEFTDAQIDAYLLKACGFDPQSARVEWDIGDGYIRSATAVSTTVDRT